MKIFLIIAALLICGAIKAEEKQITSPDGKILVAISDKMGNLHIASAIMVLLSFILLLWDL